MKEDKNYYIYINTEYKILSFSEDLAKCVTEQYLINACNHVCYEYFYGNNSPCTGCPTVKANNKKKSVSDKNTTLPKNVTAVPFKDDKGTVTKFKVNCVDDKIGKTANSNASNQNVSVLRQQVNDLRKSTELTSKVLDNIPKSIVIVDSNYAILEHNEAFKKFIKNEKKIVNKDFFKAASVFDIPKIHEIFKNAFDGVQRQSFSLKINLNSKEFSWVTLTAVLIETGKDLQYLLLYIDDVTQKEQAWYEDVLLEKFQAFSQLIARLAHDIGNPLSAIMGRIELMNKQSVFNQSGTIDYEGGVEFIKQQVDKILEVFEGVSVFNKQTTRDFCDFDLDEIIKRTISVAHLHRSAKDISIEYEIQKDLPAFYGDEIRVERALLEILKNALEATEPGGKVHVSLKYLENERIFNICVKDEGAGISDDILSKVFDPFFTTKKIKKGNGLGLSVAYSEIALHQGTININPYVSVGTEVLIILPHNQVVKHTKKSK